MSKTAVSHSSPSIQRLQALYDMAVELSALRSLESVLDSALTQCLELTASQFGFIGLTTLNAKALDVVAIQGFHPVGAFYKDNHLIPLRPNVFARAVLQNRPIRSKNASEDPHRVGQPGGHPPVGAFLGVPLRIRNKPIGMIGLANRRTPYEDEHEQLLMTYAAQVAIVIRNAQLYEELTQTNERLEQKVANRTRQLEEAKEALAEKASQLQALFSDTIDVAEQERQRIAHDMHDGINQLLIGAMLELQSSQQRLKRGDVAQAEHALQAGQVILHNTEAELRRVIHDLRPPTLDALGLAPAVRRLAERFKQYSGILCVVSVLGKPVRLPQQMEISLYRLVQEALHNVNLHAEARKASVVLAFAPQSLKVTVGDDGCGFDQTAVLHKKKRGMGLLGMQERASRLNGRLNIHSVSGQGTQVELFIPIAEEEAA